MKWFLPFLGLIFFGELFAKYQRLVLRQSPIEANYLIIFAEAIFYGYVFYNIINRVLVKKIIVLFVVVFILFNLITYFVYHSFFYFVPALLIMGLFFTFIALASLYFEFSESDHVSFQKSPNFWLSVGVSLFFSSISVSLTLYNFIHVNRLRIFDISLTNFINRVSSIILYCCLAISIISYKPKSSESLA